MLSTKEIKTSSTFKQAGNLTAMSPPPEPCILLYAELLANIRPLRLFVTATNTTQNDHPGTGPLLSLSTSLSAVTVSHIGKTLTLELPRSVSARSREFLAAGRPVSCSGENEYSFRLPIDEANPFLSATSSNDCGPEAPWPAKSMTTRTCICCRECSGILFAPSDGQAVVWKDLPGADWAELMDLWHCHKPNPIPNNNTSEDHPDLSGHTKGYGAANRVICEPGTIFVNVTSFIMAANDSQGVKRVNSKEISSPPQILPASSLCCISCGSTVGEEHTSLQGLEFFKASVSVSQKAYSSTSSTHVDKELLESYPPEVIVGFQLLECIERSGARKFVMHSGIENNQQKDGLLVWVFNTDVRYSYNSSASCGNLIISAKRALKVFYQHLDNVQPLVNPEFGLLSATSLEEIRLPPRLYDCIKGSLERSTGLLPPSGRKFKEWEVGLLDLEKT